MAHERSAEIEPNERMKFMLPFYTYFFQEGTVINSWLALPGFSDRGHYWWETVSEIVVLIQSPGMPGSLVPEKNWLGVCGPLPKPLILFRTEICNFLYPIYDLTKNSIPL